ncbi:MAG TPA: hypothetical protein VF179_13755 [Thermoanaerobaculia bacterium]|nr:hypothetical protein [Thermoanaerobaculia bacterium]
MRTFLLCLACLTILVLAQPAAAQNMSPAQCAKADLKAAPQVEPAVFLASLKAGSPDGGVETQNHCGPANWCQLECELECAPCPFVKNCFHQLCEAFCYCMC